MSIIRSFFGRRVLFGVAPPTTKIHYKYINIQTAMNKIIGERGSSFDQEKGGEGAPGLVLRPFIQCQCQSMPMPALSIMFTT